MADITHPSAEQIRQVFQDYVDRVSAGDVEGIVALYAKQATVEDPIGSPVHTGHEQIRAFYTASKGATTLSLEGRVRTVGNEGAGAMRARPVAAPEMEIETLDVMTFDAAGQITSMRAYWSPDTIVRGN
jgi:steroid delta-isomerase